MLLFLFLVGCAVVYVATIEAAFGSMVRLSERLNAERDPRHALLTRYLEDPLRLYVVTRLLRGLLFAAAAVILARLIGVATTQAVISLSIALVGFVIASEQVVPSALVRHNSGRVLELLLPSFDRTCRVCAPVAAGLLRFAGQAEDRASSDRVGEPVSTVAVGTECGESDEHRLLRSVVEFGGTLVREVMTPRPDIVAIAHDATVAECRALFAEKEYSRIPVYQGDLDKVLGFVFAKDLVTLDGVPEPSRVVPRLVRPAYVVPEGKRVADLLREMQVKHAQSAIVVDEYGGTSGLVTIEDLLEEIVGEILDEYDDDESELIIDEGDGKIIFLATVSVTDLMERLGVSVERDGFDTVGGYLLARLGRVPTVGETVEIDGLVVEVLEAERRRVRKVRVYRKAAFERETRA